MAYFRSEIKGLIYSETLLHDHRSIKKATASSPALKSSQNSSTEKLKKLILNSRLGRTDISERRHLNFRKGHPRCKNYHGSEASPRDVQLSTPVCQTASWDQCRSAELTAVMRVGLASSLPVLSTDSKVAVCWLAAICLQFKVAHGS